MEFVDIVVIALISASVWWLGATSSRGVPDEVRFVRTYHRIISALCLAFVVGIVGYAFSWWLGLLGAIIGFSIAYYVPYAYALFSGISVGVLWSNPLFSTGVVVLLLGNFLVAVPLAKNVLIQNIVVQFFTLLFVSLCF